MRVVDSHTISGALGLQVVRAARDAARGLPAAEIVAAVEAARDDYQLIVGVDKLDNLAKGGRIGKVSAFLGGMINTRVTFFVRDGEYIPLHRARGAHAILSQTMEWIGERMGDRRRGVFCVLHAMAADKAEWLRAAIEERFEVAEMHVWEVGTVISTHTGTAFGVAFLPVD